MTQTPSSPAPLPIHFVIGTGRCGSSLLHELICRHRDVRFVSNLDDRLRVGGGAARRWNSTAHRLLPPAASRKGRVRFAPSEGYRATDREVSPMLSVANRDLVAADATPWMSRRIEAFFRARYEVPGDGTLVHKWTGWPRAGLMRAVFPEARIVNVVRDGRAVANSWLQMDWWRGYEGPEHWQWGPLSEAEQATWDASGRSFPVLAALLWAKLVDSAEEARRLVPAEAWLDVRYEDLVAAPHETVATVLRFLDLPPDDEVAAEVERYAFDPTRTEAYHRDLGESAVAQMTSAISAQLGRYHYPV